MAFRYTIQEVHSIGVYPELQLVFSKPVSHVSVEFITAADDPKPRTVLILVLQRPVEVLRNGKKRKVRSCMFSMENTQTGDKQPADLVIQLQESCEIHQLALAAFRLPVLEQQTVRYYFLALRGNLRGDLSTYMKTDLCFFHFVAADKTGSARGSRDVVLQWIIRLHYVGFISWTAESLKCRGEFLNESPGLQVHQFIGSTYQNRKSNDGWNRSTGVEVSNLTVEFGVFLDPNVHRVENYCGLQLPYPPHSYSI